MDHAFHGIEDLQSESGQSPSDIGTRTTNIEDTPDQPNAVL